MNKTRLISNPDIESYINNGKFGQALYMPIVAPAGNSRLRNILMGHSKKESLQEGGLYAGLTLGDFLYDYIRINPEIVNAMDFARGGSIHNVLGFGYFASQQQELTESAFAGSINQLQGYVAERLVAHHLVAQGHDVVFPHTSNQAGWDMIVDGTKFQVKCLSNAGGIHEHFNHYDYPVLTNNELTDAVGHLHNVYIDPFLSHSEVHAITEQTLEHGAQLMDFEIPWISLGVSSAVALRNFFCGQSNLSELVTEVSTNTIGRVVFGKLGGVATQAVGLLLFGPAGAVVGGGFGAVGGVMLGKEAAKMAKGWLNRHEEKRFRDGVRSLAFEAANFMPQKFQAWQEKESQVNKGLSKDLQACNELKPFIKNKFAEDRSYYNNKQQQLRKMADDSTNDLENSQLYVQVIQLIKKAAIHPHQLQSMFKELNNIVSKDSGKKPTLESKKEFEKKQQFQNDKEKQVVSHVPIEDIRKVLVEELIKHEERFSEFITTSQKELGNDMKKDNREQTTEIINTIKKAIDQSTSSIRNEIEQNNKKNIDKWFMALEKKQAALILEHYDQYDAIEKENEADRRRFLEQLILENKKKFDTAVDKMMSESQMKNGNPERQEIYTIIKENFAVIEKKLSSVNAARVDAAVKYLTIRLEERQHVIAEYEKSILNLEKQVRSQDSVKDRFLAIKIQIEEQYSYLDSKSLEFLVTAEYVAHHGTEINNLIGGMPFTFSASVVEYCKVIENELRIILNFRDAFKIKFNDMIKEIERKSIIPFYEYTNELIELRDARNGCAHSSTADVDKLKKVQSLIFGTRGKTGRGLLETIKRGKRISGEISTGMPIK